MHILITGGSGLIGSHFIAAHQHFRFTALSRNLNSPISQYSHVNLISDLDRLEHLNDFDAVINLAGEPLVGKRWSAAQKQNLCSSRWLLTQQLVSLFQVSEQPPKVFVSGSAVGFYGDCSDQTISEGSHAAGADFGADLCERWEQLALRAEPYTRVVLLRTGIVLAPKGGALAKMLPAFKLGVGGRIASGQQYMPWIHIDDMVAAIGHLLRNPQAAGAYNLSAPEPVSNSQFSGSLAKALGRKAWLPLPAWLLALLLGEAAQLLFISQRVKPVNLMRLGFLFKYVNLDAALANLVGGAKAQVPAASLPCRGCSSHCGNRHRCNGALWRFER